MAAYEPAAIERKWQRHWAERGLYRTPDAHDGRERFMLLVEFPYPSGNLHIGHWYAFALPDMLARFLRMNGRQVMYPIGFDAFGLPAENAAIKHDTNPRDWTEGNIKKMSEQLRSMGASFDWSRQVATIDPVYYRWTQWMFIQFFKAGLAYRAKTRVNWCPTDKTVLANEQVKDGKCERDDTPVEQREIEQWMLKTTAFAQELVEGLEGLDWPEATKTAQRNWIGPSQGAEVTFALDVPGQEPGKHRVTVFTTRPDTLFGCTFLVVSPELAQSWMDVGWQAPDDVRTYVTEALSRRELDRLEREKTGVDTNVRATNPVNGESVPVWVADYVLGSYGTGAIMAVPAHDERDFEFAKAFGIPVREVIQPQANGEAEGPVYTGEGMMMNSGSYDGMASPDAKESIVSDLEAKGLAHATTTYRLRDWVLSRQRYWGCPIPLVQCESCGYVPVPDDQLPVELPPLDDYKPADDGRSPLAKAADWVKTTCPSCGGDAERETDTMDTFVDSSWYFMRYTDPANPERFADADKLSSWVPVPMYVGGAEHNTMHLLYSRFWTRAMHRLGLVPFQEPFLGRRNRGIILGSDGQKMSKSRGNVVDPDDLVARYGSDTVRLYLAFMAPYDQGGPWDPNGINGVHRFLKRFWSFVHEHSSDTGEASDVARRAVYRATKDIGDDLANLRLNTTVSGAMKMLNTLEGESVIPRDLLAHIVTILAPMAPHITEELWSDALRNEGSVHEQPWPSYDESLIGAETIEWSVLLGNKVLDRFPAPREATSEDLRARVSELTKVSENVGNIDDFEVRGVRDTAVLIPKKKRA